MYKDGKIYGEGPQKVEQREAKKPEEEKKENQTKAITKYGWLDEASKVKVYIDTSVFPTKINDDMITVDFKMYQFELKVVDKDNITHVLLVSPLWEHINAEKSIWKFSEKRISLTLRKLKDEPWTDLMKPMKIQMFKDPTIKLKEHVIKNKYFDWMHDGKNK
jgi:hypothetical protein